MPKHTQILDIRVTLDHIEKGEPYNAHSCPIALAMQEQFPGYAVALFDDDGELNMVYRTKESQRSEFEGLYQPRDSVVQWVRRYDEERNTGPCTLRLFKTRNRAKDNYCEIVDHDDPDP